MNGIFLSASGENRGNYKGLGNLPSAPFPDFRNPLRDYLLYTKRIGRMSRFISVRMLKSNDIVHLRDSAQKNEITFLSVCHFYGPRFDKASPSPTGHQLNRLTLSDGQNGAGCLMPNLRQNLIRFTQ
jgi:hypothetical protein